MNKIKDRITKYYSTAGYTGIAGGLRIIGDLMVWICVAWYVVSVGGILPLYVRDYNSMGTDKAEFWIRSYKRPVDFLIIGIAFLLSAFIVKLVAGDDEVNKLTERLNKLRLFDVITPSHIWGCLFLSSVMFSYTLSEFREVASQGETGWYCGAEEYAVIVICLFVISMSGFGGRLFSGITLLSTFAVNVLGILMDIFGNIFSFTGWDETKVSTIGNANWFCGYTVVTYFLAVAMYYFEVFGTGKLRPVIKNFLRVYLFAGAYMYVMNGSASGYVALIAVFVMLLLFGKKDAARLFTALEIVTIFSLGVLAHSIALGLGAPSRSNDVFGDTVNSPLFAILLFAACIFLSVFLDMRMKKGMTRTRINIGKVTFITAVSALFIYIVLLSVNTVSGGALFGTGSIMYLGRSWGNSRGMTIEAGLRIFSGFSFREMLFGTGPDTFYSVYTGGRYPELLDTLTLYFGGLRLTNAHCEPVSMLVNTGILGTVTFYGMLISFVIKGLKGADVKNAKGAVAAGASLCVLAYVINNLFSFQNALNLSQLSLVLSFGTGAVLRMNGTEKK